tara:strand:- start:16213 stop:17355 length:1143 start_codon:yes stop_codon:yes gene_type:complete
MKIDTILKITNVKISFIFFLIALVLPLFFLLFIGIQSSSDVQRNLIWTKTINISNLNILEIFEFLISKKGLQGPTFIVNTFLLKVSLLFEDNWNKFYIFVNYIFLILFIIYSQKIIEKKDLNIFRFLLIFFLLLNYDFLLWFAFTLPDFIFSIFVFFVIYNFYRKNYIYFIFFLLFSLFLKNTGIVLIYILVQLIIINFINLNIKYKLIFLLIFNLFTGIVITSLIHFSIYSLNIDNYTLNLIKSFNEAGFVIHDRPYINFTSSNELLDFIKLYFLRCLYFFKFIDIKFSNNHNIINLFVYTPMIILSLLSLLRIKNFDHNYQKLIVIISIVILSFSNFHAITWIDYDWRYRVVILIPLLFMSVLGAINLKTTLIKNKIF